MPCFSLRLKIRDCKVPANQDAIPAGPQASALCNGPPSLHFPNGPPLATVPAQPVQNASSGM